MTLMPVMMMLLSCLCIRKGGLEGTLRAAKNCTAWNKNGGSIAEGPIQLAFL
jgi:hypothetical protein